MELPSDFCEIAAKIYASEPKESPAEVAFLFSSAHSFFDRGEAWAKTEGGTARLAGFFDPSLRISESKVAYFGYWETLEELEPNRKLFSEFEAWAREKGATHVYGPVSFTTLLNYRLQASGFDAPEYFPTEPRNPKYYLNLIEKLGYRSAQEYVSYWSGDLPKVQGWAVKLASKGVEGARSRFEFSSIDPSEWLQNLERYREIANRIFAENLGFVEIDSRTFAMMYGEAFLKRICLDTSVLIRERETGKVAGFCINFSSTSATLPTTLYLKTVGIVPEYREQGTTMLALILEVLKRASSYRRFCLCLMRNGNFPSLFMKGLAETTRSYRLYEKKLL